MKKYTCTYRALWYVEPTAFSSTQESAEILLVYFEVVQFWKKPQFCLPYFFFLFAPFSPLEKKLKNPDLTRIGAPLFQ